MARRVRRMPTQSRGHGTRTRSARHAESCHYGQLVSRLDRKRIEAPLIDMARTPFHSRNHCIEFVAFVARETNRPRVQCNETNVSAPATRLMCGLSFELGLPSGEPG